MSELTPDLLRTDKYWIGQYQNANIAFIVLDTVFVVGRLASRKFLTTANLSWDDLLVVLAWLANMFLCGFGIMDTQYSFKSFDFGVTPAQEAHFTIKVLQAVYAIQISWVFAVTFAKLSILVMYLRIFASKPIVKKITWALIGYQIVLFIIYLFGTIFLCNPPHIFWDRQDATEGSCMNYSAFDNSENGPQIFSDIVMLILPIPTTLSLNVSLLKRLGIVFTFLTGSMGMIASLVRWCYLLIYTVHTTDLRRQEQIQMWTIIECGFYLIAACLPPMRAIFTHSKLFGEQLSVIFRSNRDPLSSGKSSKGGSNYHLKNMSEATNTDLINGGVTTHSTAHSVQSDLETGDHSGISVQKDVSVSADSRNNSRISDDKESHF